MAVVVLCGLATSSALSLFVLPALYLRFGPASHGRCSRRRRRTTQDASELAFEFGDESTVETPAR